MKTAKDLIFAFNSSPCPGHPEHDSMTSHRYQCGQCIEKILHEIQDDVLADVVRICAEKQAYWTGQAAVPIDRHIGSIALGRSLEAEALRWAITGMIHDNPERVLADSEPIPAPKPKHRTLDLK